MAASRSSAASANRPSMHHATPNVALTPGKQLILAGCASHPQRAFGVSPGLFEAVEVDLSAGELHDGVEAAGKVVV